MVNRNLNRYPSRVNNEKYNLFPVGSQVLPTVFVRRGLYAFPSGTRYPACAVNTPCAAIDRVYVRMRIHILPVQALRFLSI